MTTSQRRDDSLQRAAREIERFVASTGWDQTTRLFALVDTAALLQREPALAEELTEQAARESDDDNGLAMFTSVEQDGLPVHTDPVELLAAIAWPDDVDGAALAVEMFMLPDDIAVPDDPLMAQQTALHHPQRQELRVVVAVLRSGQRSAALRWRRHDADDEVVDAPELVATLGEALMQTLA